MKSITLYEWYMMDPDDRFEHLGQPYIWESDEAEEPTPVEITTDNPRDLDE